MAAAGAGAAAEADPAARAGGELCGSSSLRHNTLREASLGRPDDYRRHLWSTSGWRLAPLPACCFTSGTSSGASSEPREAAHHSDPFPPPGTHESPPRPFSPVSCAAAVATADDQQAIISHQKMLEVGRASQQQQAKRGRASASRSLSAAASPPTTDAPTMYRRR